MNLLLSAAGIGSIVAIILFIVVAVIVANLRRVVSTNEVHIVQTSKKTTSYGKEMPAGNTYYEWPTWLPIIGLNKIVLPVSVFDLDLKAYEAYDKERVPFIVDVKAFFRISDSNTAAQRVEDFEELHGQLTAVVQGAVRTILASHEIDAIMLERSKFGDQFTKEVEEQLTNWGVEAVKNIELMDIRDSAGSQVIHNIMSKRTSAIETESRQVVANNRRIAEIAEIESQRDVELQSQNAAQLVGQRTADKDKAIGISQELAKQEVREQQKVTQQKDMAVLEVKHVRTAEIEKSVNLVKADEVRQVAVIQAEGQRQQTEVIAAGNLTSTKLAAEGIAAEGQAKAQAEQAMLMAPVNSQITLAKEIGSNDGYQRYLVTIRQVEANQVVGEAQAKALEKANVKVISNTGTPTEGLNGVMDLFSAKGGLQLGSMLESLANTDTGKAVVDAVVGKKPN